MNEDRFSKHIEYKEALKTYEEYLGKLNSEAKKKLEGKVNFLDKMAIKGRIKRRTSILETISDIKHLDAKAHLSGDTIARENEELIAVLNNLPVLENDADKKIVATFVGEEGKIFDNERQGIKEARRHIKELLTSISAKSGFVEIDKGIYKDLGKLFSESLGDLSVFDLKVGSVHKEVSNKEAAELAATKVDIIDDYKKYVSEGKLTEVSSLPLKNVPSVRNIVIMDAKNRFCLEKLEVLLTLMPKKNEKTCKVIAESIKSYKEKIARVEEKLQIDFNDLAARVNEVKESERRMREEEKQKKIAHYTLEERKEFYNKVAFLSYQRYQGMNLGRDVTLIDKQIKELMDTDIASTFNDTDIYSAKRAGALKYAELNKIPFDEKEFSASLNGDTGIKL